MDIWRKIGPEGEVESEACWSLVLDDAELASIMGRGDEGQGKAMLEVMKMTAALDSGFDGMIRGENFRMLYSPSVLMTAKDAVLCLDPASYLSAL